MIRIYIIQIVLFLALILSMTSSCTKEIVGCTDPQSKNFNPLAESDDGSCQYEGQIVLWFNEALSDHLVENGSVTLTYYLDGKQVTQSSTNLFWATEPSCGQSGSVTLTKDLGSSKAGTTALSIKDQNGWEYWSAVLNINVNGCLKLQLTL